MTRRTLIVSLSLVFSITLMVCVIAGCMPRIKLFSDGNEPLRETTLQGTGKAKILLIPVRGTISDAPQKELLRSAPGMVRRVVSHLEKARKDPNIKAVILKVDSPGGTVTASDMLYHELLEYKKQTGVKLVSAMTGVAASGGYYISLPADRIIAHPTTITGSIGVIFIRPVMTGLMDKIGVAVDIHKTGENKDMGSPFKNPVPSEQAMMDDMVRELGERFFSLLKKHRKLPPGAFETISTARIFLGPEAQKLGLVDQVGYMGDAIEEARKLAGLPENAKLVVYRRADFPDDNIYNTAATRYEGGVASLMELNFLPPPTPGFYYLWPAAILPE